LLIPENVIVSDVEDCVTPLNVTFHIVPDVKPLSVKDTEKVCPETKLAVIVPGLLTFAVVEADDGLLNVIDPVVVQLENLKPELGVADIGSPPASSQTFVPDGVVVPPPEGLTANDTSY